VEDSAQGYPAQNPASYWHGDLVVVSFGRGKPVNLLGGGAVLTHNEALYQHLPRPVMQNDSLASSLKYALKRYLYNQTIRPFAYGLLSRLPGLHIGQTIYKPLHEINGMHQFAYSLFEVNRDIYTQRGASQSAYSRILGELNDPRIIDLPLRLQHDMQQPLLRYPILLTDKALRDRAYQALAHYGASTMYKRPLPEIENVAQFLKKTDRDFTQASRLADHLLTLPTHEGVNEAITTRIEGVLLQLLRS
jgi:dTDP-4-amino-4,6-dideoxygalactose transaminase